MSGGVDDRQPGVPGRGGGLELHGRTAGLPFRDRVGDDTMPREPDDDLLEVAPGAGHLLGVFQDWHDRSKRYISSGDLG